MVFFVKKSNMLILFGQLTIFDDFIKFFVAKRKNKRYTIYQKFNFKVRRKL